MSNPTLKNERAHDTKLVLLFKTLGKYRDLSDLLRSPIVLHVPPQMSFTVLPVRYATSYTLTNQEDD